MVVMDCCHSGTFCNGIFCSLGFDGFGDNIDLGLVSFATVVAFFLHFEKTLFVDCHLFYSSKLTFFDCSLPAQV